MRKKIELECSDERNRKYGKLEESNKKTFSKDVRIIFDSENCENCDV